MDNTMKDSSLKLIEELESEVRSYSKNWPATFETAKGDKLWDTNGNEYIDFFAGAGALNYGHNNTEMQNKLIEYLKSDSIIHSLDMATPARSDFLKKFHDIILTPRQLDYKVMFPGPTGTNSVESALKIARKVTGRETIFNFTNAFHGMTLGSLAVTGNKFKRQGAGVSLSDSVTMPFDSYLNDYDSIAYIEQMLEDNGSGVALPAAIILETVQGEGGINTVSMDWLKKVDSLCKKWDILLIIDDIQAGNGRTGTFFSFEPAGIKPDIICLSKSIGGIGLPMALTLIKPEYDQWSPGEHNGTFRGNTMAFIAASEALNYWKNTEFEITIREKGGLLSQEIDRLIDNYPKLKAKHRGRGLMQGLVIDSKGWASEISYEAFKHGLIIETAGPDDEVIKFLPPLIISKNDLAKGIKLLEKSIQVVLSYK